MNVIFQLVLDILLVLCDCGQNAATIVGILLVLCDCGQNAATIVGIFLVLCDCGQNVATIVLCEPSLVPAKRWRLSNLPSK